MATSENAPLVNQQSQGPVKQPNFSEAEKKFHTNFSTVPLNEKLVEDYSCSYSKSKIIRPGRLYVTGVRCCFLPSLGGESFSVLWQDVLSIEKKSKLIATVIEVNLEGGMAYAFTAFSYGSGDNVYKTLQMLHSLRRGYQQRENLKQSNSVGSLAGSTSASFANPQQTSPPAPSPQASTDSPPAATKSPQEVIAETAAKAPATPPQAAPQPTVSDATENAVAKNQSFSTPPVGPAAPATSGIATSSPSKLAAGARSVEHGTVVIEEEVGSPAEDTPRTSTVEAGSFADPLAATKPPSDIKQEARATSSTARDESTKADNTEQLKTTSFDMDALLESNSGETNDAASPVARRGSTVGPASSSPPQSCPQSPIKSAEVPTQVDNSSRANIGQQSPPPKAPESQHRSSKSPERVASEAPAQKQQLPVAPHQQQHIEANNRAQPSSKSNRQESKNNRDQKKKTTTQRPQEEFDGEGANRTTTAANDIFKAFPSIPKTENILDTFQCSFVSGVHRLGKMHITGHYILFNSMMMADSISVKFTEVASVEKLQTMLILDGITIVTYAGDRYDFTSFINRENAFTILKQLFDTHSATATAMGVKRAMSPSAEPAAKGKKGGEKKGDDKKVEEKKEPGNLSANASMVATGSDGSLAASPPMDSQSFAATATSNSPTSPTVSSPIHAAPQSAIKTTCLKVRAPMDYPVGNLVDWDKHGHPWGDNGMSPSIDKIMNGKDSKFVQQATKLVKGCDINDVFRVAWDNNVDVASEFRDYRKDTKWAYEDWAPCTGVEAGCSGTRDFTADTIIKALVATSCKLVEHHKFVMMVVDGKPTLIVESSAQAKGVPYSDAFRAEQIMLYQQEGQDEEAQVTVRSWLSILWIKSVWALKGKIQSSALSETTDCAEKFVSLIINPALERDKAARSGGAALPPPIKTPTSSEAGSRGFSPALGSTTAAVAGGSSGFAPVAAASVTPAMKPLPAEAVLGMKVCLGFCALCLLTALWNLFWMPTYIYPSSVGDDGKELESVGLSAVYPVISGFAAVSRSLLFALVWFLASQLPVVYQRIEEYLPKSD